VGCVGKPILFERSVGLLGLALMRDKMFIIFKNNMVFNKITALVVTVVFLCTTLISCNGWGAVDANSPALEMSLDNGQLSTLDVNTFSIPAHLGEVKFSSRGDSRRVVIHIQDAHCNAFAQHQISDIIDYLSREYGTRLVNLEGGAGAYDLRIFTSISGEAIRKEVADYFVKKGELNGAEFYAINNPEKVALWGIEDKDLYLANLKVYRDSLVFKDEVRKYLDELTHILNNLKRFIHTPELLKMDVAYAAYKSGNMTFKDYLEFIIDKAKEHRVDISKFPDLSLLSQVLDEEKNVDFQKANRERNAIIEELRKNLSRVEAQELMEKTVSFKTKRLSVQDYYGYLLRKAREMKMSEKRFPVLVQYMGYVGKYAAVNRSMIMDELDALEDAIKDPLYKNEVQRQLNLLSKDLAILKNMFDISLTKTDYKYYLANTSSFEIRNYTVFIERESPKYRVSAKLSHGVEKLDDYREDIARFFEYSYKRDDAFLKNMRFEKLSDGIECAVLMTGGFHTENLCELFRDEGISYVSVLPSFTSPKDYETPYYDLLAGQITGNQEILRTALAQTALLQVASMLSSGLAEGVWKKDGIEAFNEEVRILEFVSEWARLHPEEGGRVVVKDGDKVLFPVDMGKQPDANIIEIDISIIRDMAQDIFIDAQINDILKGRPESYGDIRSSENVAKAVAFFDGMVGKLNALAEKETDGQKKGVLLELAEDLGKIGKRGLAEAPQIRALDGIEGFLGHAGGRGIYVSAALDDRSLVAVLIHEAVAAFAKDNMIPVLVQQIYEGKKDFSDLIGREPGKDRLDIKEDPVWAIAKEQRGAGGRDTATGTGVAEKPSMIDEARQLIMTKEYSETGFAAAIDNMFMDMLTVPQGEDFGKAIAEFERLLNESGTTISEGAKTRIVDDILLMKVLNNLMAGNMLAEGIEGYEGVKNGQAELNRKIESIRELINNATLNGYVDSVNKALDAGDLETAVTEWGKAEKDGKFQNDMAVLAYIRIQKDRTERALRAWMVSRYTAHAVFSELERHIKVVQVSIGCLHILKSLIRRGMFNEEAVKELGPESEKFSELYEVTEVQRRLPGYKERLWDIAQLKNENMNVLDVLDQTGDDIIYLKRFWERNENGKLFLDWADAIQKTKSDVPSAQGQKDFIMGEFTDFRNSGAFREVGKYYIQMGNYIEGDYRGGEKISDLAGFLKKWLATKDTFHEKKVFERIDQNYAVDDGIGLDVLSDYLFIISIETFLKNPDDAYTRGLQETQESLDAFMKDNQDFMNALAEEHGFEVKESMDVDVVRTMSIALRERLENEKDAGAVEKLSREIDELDGIRSVLEQKEARARRMAEGKVKIRAAFYDDKKYVILRFEDDATGVRPEQAKKIFNFNESSKSGGGLGLAISKKLITDGGGRIDVYLKVRDMSGTGRSAVAPARDFVTLTDENGNIRRNDAGDMLVQRRQEGVPVGKPLALVGTVFEVSLPQSTVSSVRSVPLEIEQAVPETVPAPLSEAGSEAVRREAFANALFDNIGKGFTEAELRRRKEEIKRGNEAVSKAESNKKVVEDVSYRCRQLIGLIDEKRGSIKGILVDKLKISDDEAEKAVEKVKNVLERPETQFSWFESDVEGPEKYLLGHESALAVDIIRYLGTIEGRQGVPGNLIDEYILHEALEKMVFSDENIKSARQLSGLDRKMSPEDVKHRFIIGLTSEIFDRDKKYDEAAKTPGDTPLGKALRGYIDSKAKVVETVSAARNVFSMARPEKNLNVILVPLSRDQLIIQKSQNSSMAQGIKRVLSRKYGEDIVMVFYDRDMTKPDVDFGLGAVMGGVVETYGDRLTKDPHPGIVVYANEADRGSAERVLRERLGTSLNNRLAGIVPGNFTTVTENEKFSLVSLAAFGQGLVERHWARDAGDAVRVASIEGALRDLFLAMVENPDKFVKENSAELIDRLLRGVSGYLLEIKKVDYEEIRDFMKAEAEVLQAL